MKIPGTRKNKHGLLQAFVRVHQGAGGLKYSDWRPVADWTPAKVRAWQDDTRAVWGKGAAGTLAADIELLLEKPDIQARAGYRHKARHLNDWIRWLDGRNRSRHEITTQEVADALAQLETEGFSGSSCNQYRAALSFVYTALNGAAGRNPVRATKRVPDLEPEPRGLPIADLERVIASMPQWSYGPGRPTHDAEQRGSKRRSLAPVRARVMLYTGLPQRNIQRLTKQQVRSALATGILAGVDRHKGAGIGPRDVRLTAPGRKALAEFDQLDAYGYFHIGSFWRTLKKALTAANLPHVRPYDLRHSFLSHMYVVTKDLATVARLALHGKRSRETARYTSAANAAVDQAAVLAFDASLVTK